MSSSKKATPPPRATPQDPNSKPRRESKAQQPESKPSEPKSKSHSESRSQQPESMPRDQIPKPPKEARAQQQESKPPEPISRSQGEPNPPRSRRESRPQKPISIPRSQREPRSHHPSPPIPTSSTLNHMQIEPLSGNSNPRVTIPTQAKCDEHNFARFHFSSSFTCSGCERESQGVRYRCTTCDNAFHDQCQTFKETKDDHRHTYKLRYHRKIFKCDGCKEEGFGKRFRCDQCGHELHTLCMFPEEPGKIWCTKLEFDFHREETNSGKICYACTKDIDGYYYHCANYKKIDDNTCTQDGMYLHPCCVKLKPTLIGVFGKAESNKDETLYNLTIDKEYQKNIKCFLCNHNQLRTPHRTDEHYRGWSYVSATNSHRYHVYCVRNLVHEAWVTANGQDINHMDQTLENMLEKQLTKRGSSGSWSNSSSRVVWKILTTILKMIASTLMGDPTFGIVHVFGTLMS